MNFNEAIIAHSRWRNRLEQVIGGRESVDVAAARRDDACPLGIWLHDAGSRSEIPATVHEKLLRVHARFHAVAADLAQAGLLVEGGFSRVSCTVIQILAALAAHDVAGAARLDVEEPPTPRTVARHGNPYLKGVFITVGLLVGIVAAVADTLAAEIAAMSQASSSVTTAAADVTENVSSIAATVEEMSGAIREISQGVESAAA